MRAFHRRKSTHVLGQKFVRSFYDFADLRTKTKYAIFWQSMYSYLCCCGDLFQNMDSHNFHFTEICKMFRSNLKSFENVIKCVTAVEVSKCAKDLVLMSHPV